MMKPLVGVLALAAALGSCSTSADPAPPSPSTVLISIEFCSTALCPDSGPALEGDVTDVLQALLVDRDALDPVVTSPEDVNAEAARIAGFGETQLFGPRISLTTSVPHAIRERYGAAPGVFSLTNHDGHAQSLSRLAEDETLNALVGTELTCLFCGRTWPPVPIDAKVFLCDGTVCPPITEQAQDDLVAAFMSDNDISAFEFESKLDAYTQFVEAHARDADLLSTAHSDLLPAAYRLRVTAGADVAALAARYQELPGVEEVVEFAGDFFPPVDYAFVRWLREATLPVLDESPSSA